VDELAVTGLDTREAQAMISLEAGEAAFTADLAATQRHLERSLALYRPLGDAWRTAGVLYRLGINRGHASDYAGSEQLLNEAIELYQKLGVSSGIANAQRGLAQNQVRLGKTESGLALMRKVIATSQTSGDRAQTMLDLRTLALLMMWSGLYDDILPLFHQALSLAQDLGNRYEIAFISVVFGMYGLVTGQYELSRRHLALSLELGRRDGFQREVAASLWSLGCVTLVEKTPQEARPFFQESTAVYRQVGHQDELSWALSLDAFCSLALGEAGQARQRLVEALDIAVSIRGYLSTLFALVVGAVWLGGQGEGGKALEMYEPAARQPVFANSPWFHDLFGKSIETYTAGLPGEIATAARERGRTKDLFEALVALAEELKP
jgi:tetratricopeptide (TPR) repeat protein